ncbi:MAG: flagellar filament capping protein FliD, partial [Telluria sp.]
STTPTALDAAGGFSRPGQNMVTVLNRVEVTFKAQFSELGEMRHSLVAEQAAAKQLTGLSADSSSADIKAGIDHFVQTYNAGVNRFAPAVDKGGILEGSWEAGRARFATQRDISYILNGSEVGIKGDLAKLGITTDPKSGLAMVDNAKLDGALAKDKGHVAASVTAFANTFVTTVDFLNAKGHSQQRQMANLNRAVTWIGDNKASVQKEFGPGAAATPNEAFAKAAALYDEMAKLDAMKLKTS